jgi:2'-5' RNA ligase
LPFKQPGAFAREPQALMAERQPSKAGLSVYYPFIDDPDHIALVEGERFVVLRPTGIVRDAHDQIRTLIKRRFPALPVSYPAQAHVTLTGFPKGTRLESVQELVGQWAATIPRLRLEVERVSVFPSPHQIVIVQVRRTAELFDALVSLRESARQFGLRDLPMPPVAEWIFHMSVAYCSSLNALGWADLVHCVETAEVLPEAQCVVSEVEVAAFDGGQEYSGGVFGLSALEAAPGSAPR